MSSFPEVLHEQTWTHDNRPNLHMGEEPAPAGPWWGEPDKVQWIDGKTDLDCLAVRNRSGAWCGYVGVPPGHPAHGLDYDDVQAEVHGGLTFAGPCMEDAPEGHGVCHIPLEGRTDDIWWLGFDCAHAFDLSPAMLGFERAHGIPDIYTREDSYWTLDMVKQEVAILALLLKIQTA